MTKIDLLEENDALIDLLGNIVDSVSLPKDLAARADDLLPEDEDEDEDEDDCCCE